jgi:hypothetical protein
VNDIERELKMDAQETISVRDALNRKRELELDLEKMMTQKVRDFQVLTGLCITDIHIRTIHVNSYAKDQPRLQIMGVDLEVRLE